MRMEIIAALVLSAGCGGTAAKYKVDDVALAQIPVAEKQAIFTAENEVAIAKSEQAKAGADLRTADDERAIAEKEQEQARLETQKARLERDAAKNAHDDNKLAAGERAVKLAEVGERAATAKVDWIDGRRRWQKALASAAEEHIAAASAKVELEKARLAQAKGIKPTPDFDVSRFDEDYSRRDRRWAEARIDADKAKIEVDKRERTWRDLDAQHTQMAASK